jgi:porin
VDAHSEHHAHDFDHQHGRFLHDLRFDDFGDGLSWTGEADFKYKLGDLPGGQNVGVLYSFRSGVHSAWRPPDLSSPGEGTVARQLKTTPGPSTGAVGNTFTSSIRAPPRFDLANGEQDLEGLGLFARFGFADQDTNPVEWSFSGGIGGRGIIPSRDNDTFGVGYFYSSIQTGRLSGLIGVGDEAQGFETFYNCALTPRRRTSRSMSRSSSHRHRALMMPWCWERDWG